MTRRHANRQIAAAEVIELLGPNGPEIKNEAQARPLVGLDAPTVVAVFDRAREATAGNVTAASLQKAKIEIVPPTRPSRRINVTRCRMSSMACLAKIDAKVVALRFD